MSTELARLRPDASGHLRIAARGRHVERWKLPRGAYADGREGYLAWRTEQARRHAARVDGFMAEAGYGERERHARLRDRQPPAAAGSASPPLRVPAVQHPPSPW